MFQGNGTKHLKYVMSFLPIARSSASLEYFHTLRKDSREYNGGVGDPEAVVISDGRTGVVGMDLGLKDALFDQYLVEDSVWLVLAFGLVASAILAFTRSFFVTFGRSGLGII